MIGDIEKADIFIRHGDFEKPKWPTYSNFQRIFTDRTLRLTQRGEEEVKDSIITIPNIQSIDLILASPYKRTQESAQVAREYIKELSGSDVPVITTDLLKEIEVQPDILSRREFYSIIVRNQGRLDPLKESLFDKWRFGKAKESPPEVESRIKNLLNELARFHREGKKKILLVSHASFGRAFKRFLSGKEITLPRNEDKTIKKAGTFYILPTTTGSFKLLE